MVEPASNLQVLEVSSKSMRLSWEPSSGDVSGYRVQLIPLKAGSKRQELYVDSKQTSALVRDLSPETQYQVHLFGLRGLTASEAVTASVVTQPVKVSLGEKNKRNLGRVP